jgi:ethanolamine ammonia-lyase small subunit
MQNENGDIPGTKLQEWHDAAPSDITDAQVAELQILKFRTVEQVATASDAQMMRVGMGGVGLRLKAQAFLRLKSDATSSSELAEAKAKLAALEAQVAALVAAKDEAPRRGRPPMNDRSA